MLSVGREVDAIKENNGTKERNYVKVGEEKGMWSGVVDESYCL